MLLLGIFGSCLFFLSIFLLFIKKEFQNTDIVLTIPKILWLSSLSIILSSIALFLARKTQENQNFKFFRIWLGSTFFLGILFLAFQMQGWKTLYLENNQNLSKHTGSAYLLLLSVMHLLHTLGGLVGLSITIYKVFRNTSFADSFVYSVNPPNQLNLRLVSIYWHFLAVLWIIIFLFLLYHAS
jgi:cytochrome c oxidase subunit 3